MSESVKIKVRIVTCTHETKHGVDAYTKLVKKDESIHDVVASVMEACDYNEDQPARGEYFDYEVEHLIIDINDFELASSEEQEQLESRCRQY